MLIAFWKNFMIGWLPVRIRFYPIVQYFSGAPLVFLSIGGALYTAFILFLKLHFDPYKISIS